MFQAPVEAKRVKDGETLYAHMKAVTSGGVYKEMALAEELAARQYEHPEVIAHIVRTLG